MRFCRELKVGYTADNVGGRPKNSLHRAQENFAHNVTTCAALWKQKNKKCRDFAVSENCMHVYMEPRYLIHHREDVP